tara:strand:- start:718 stop:1695 length:978 start_codon:yes stop_codon:yes gene_type:complete
MSLDFLKNPTVKTMVEQRYNDQQLNRTMEYLKGYKGSNVFKDWQRDIPFDITPENREAYWDIYNNLSPLGVEDTENAFIKSVQLDLDNAPTPAEKLFVLRDGQSIWSNNVSNHFKEQTDILGGYITADSLNKGQIQYEQDFSGRVNSTYGKGPKLDAMMSEANHIKDGIEIEKYGMWDNALIHNGRLSTRDVDGNITVGANAGLDLDEKDLPAWDEQLEVSRIAYNTLKKVIPPALKMARYEFLESKREADTAMLASAEKGELSKENIIPAVSNMLMYKDSDTAEVVRKGAKGVFKHSLPQEVHKLGGKFIAGVMNAAFKRGHDI